MGLDNSLRPSHCCMLDAINRHRFFHSRGSEAITIDAAQKTCRQMPSFASIQKLSGRFELINERARIVGVASIFLLES
jgi:hypothetical protein